MPNNESNSLTYRHGSWYHDPCPEAVSAYCQPFDTAREATVVECSGCGGHFIVPPITIEVLRVKSRTTRTPRLHVQFSRHPVGAMPALAPA